ncbi:lipopolysaccharide biosynthesis protein [Pseudomonas sp. R5(2019)]|uniref:lipopolysaccharide biosynthesis protein n=1 Tax=Pseudomonas sp. R5(2019) TaxID=2697566 RepID=UPI001411C405|nr:oligosaccharide flippase family protein [Pseudomonas sp. R5(2019)]NBA97276.1 oligosaccharide flippase family protein [Pseudomonas sp. R5(2019)]
MNSWLKKSLALYSANGLNFLLNIVIIPILVYYIGFQGYGFYSVYIILSSTLLFLDSALSKSAVNAIYSAKEEQRAQLVSSSRAAYIIAGIALLLATPMIAKGVSVLFPLYSEQLNLAYWIGAAAAIEYVLALPGQYFQMLNVLRARHFAYAQYQLCIQLSRFLAVVIVAATTQQIEWVLAAVVLRKIPDYLILWLFWRKQESEPTTPVAWPVVTTLYRQAAPIIGVALLLVLATEFISIYVSHAYGAETLGKYRSVYDVLNKIWFVATLYPVLVYPKICEWLADTNKKAWLQNMMPYLNLGSALVYGALTLAGLAIYPLMVHWIPALGDAAPFAAGLLAGICMSGHVRLGYEFLQAQKDAGAALLINLLSLGAGAATLFAFYGEATSEIGWAWFVSQLLAVIIVDIRNGILLSSSLRKSVIGLLPWLGVGIGVFITTSIHGMEGTVTSLLLLAVFMSSLAILAKRLRNLRQVKCAR